MERIINARIRACLTEAIALTDNIPSQENVNKLFKNSLDFYVKQSCDTAIESPEPTENVVPIKKKTPKKKVSKKKVSKKEAITGDTKGVHTLLKTIGDLPDGDVELVKAPFHLLEALPLENRVRYISGLAPGDFITAENLAQAVKSGAKKNLAIQFIEHQNSKAYQVEDPITRFPKKTESFIASAIEIMGVQGAELFNHMTRNGANKTVLLDFKAIAIAVKKGQV